MKKLALFDVDFTITSKETLMEFYKYNIKLKKKNIIYLPRAIFSGLMFILKIYDERQTKECFLKFIKGMEEKELKDIVTGFYKDRLKKIFYSDGLKMIEKLKNEGYYTILISASPEFYLNELYDLGYIDKIIGTRYIFEDGKFACKMLGNNCKGKEKVKRLNEFLKEKNMEVDFKNSYMFSDSLSDKPLLDLVGKPYLINCKKDNEIEILKWK